MNDRHVYMPLIFESQSQYLFIVTIGVKIKPFRNYSQSIGTGIYLIMQL